MGLLNWLVERAKAGEFVPSRPLAALSRCLRMGFCSTSKIATVLPRVASYLGTAKDIASHPTESA